MVGLQLPLPYRCPESDRANLRTLVALLKKTKVLSLDRIKTTWPILSLLNRQHLAFPQINGLRLEFQEEVYDTFMQIPDQLLENLTDLALAEVTYNQDKDKFMSVTRRILSKTKKLKNLSIFPSCQPEAFTEVLAEYAPVLQKLESLTMVAKIFVDDELYKV